MKLIDLTNQRFGKLLVLERDFSKTKGTYWKCKCDCGNIISVRKDQLTRSKYPKKSCGCDQKEKASQTHLKNEIGKTYGYLTVLYRVEDLRKGEARWHCKCKCGNECDVSGIHLRNGSVQSCGCKKHESHNFIDETGKKYGKLTVISKSDKTDGTHLFWNCKCDCGNSCIVSGTNLRSGITQSCGCLHSKGEEKISKILIENQILFKKEYTFKDLLGVNNGLLRFDFAIFNEDGTLSHLIEYDGIQHFKQIDYFDNNQNFQNRQENDKRKNLYCEKNNIKLIRIKYNDIITLEKIMLL